MDTLVKNNLAVLQMNKYIALSTLALASLISQPVFAFDCKSFDAEPLGTRWIEGDSITEPGVTINFARFRNVTGGFTSTYAEILDDDKANGVSTPELELNNINMQFIYSPDLPSTIMLKYAETGGDVNLGINGTRRAKYDMIDFNGTSINGVDIDVSETPIPNRPPNSSDVRGVVVLTGDIERFSIGGQELRIDDICPLSIPF